MQKIFLIFSEYLEECGLTSSFESFLCSKGLIFEDFETINQEEQLRKQLLDHIKHELNTTPNKIKERQFKNPFPIGTRSVYVFASGGVISDGAKWKLLIFFESQQ